MKKLLLIALLTFNVGAFATELTLKPSESISSTVSKLPDISNIDLPITFSNPTDEVSPKKYHIEFEFLEKNQVFAKGELGGELGLKEGTESSFSVKEKGTYLKVEKKKGGEEDKKFEELDLGLEVTFYIKPSKVEGNVEVKYIVKRNKLTNMVAFETNDEIHYLPEIDVFITAQYVVLPLDKLENVFNTQMAGKATYGKGDRSYDLKIKVTEIK